MRRITLLVLLLLLAAVASPATPGLTQTSQPAGTQPNVGIRADFNQDGFADLAVSAPDEDVGSIQGAGAVSILYGSSGGVTTTGGQLFTQDSPGIPGISESLDGFGSALTSGGLGADPAAAASSGSNPTTRLPTTGR